MKIALVNIGKTDKSTIREGITDYQKRLGHFVDFSISDLPDVRQVKSMSSLQIKQKEGETILKSINKGDILVLLDEKGIEFSSREFSDWLAKLINLGSKNLVFVTGGAFGFSDEVYKTAQYRLSLSKMTFTHQMVRLIFVEQLYRAFTILKGIPYHND